MARCRACAPAATGACGPAWLRWLPFAWSDYWILYVDPAYRHAVVGTPDRKRLWLLSRTPDIAPTDYERLLTQVRDSSHRRLRSGVPTTAWR